MQTGQNEQNMIYKILQRKLRFSNTNHTKNRRWTYVLRKGKKFNSISSTGHRKQIRDYICYLSYEHVFFRCKLLEQSLQEHNISVDNSELDKLKTELTSTDLDF